MTSKESEQRQKPAGERKDPPEDIPAKPEPFKGPLREVAGRDKRQSTRKKK